MELDNDYSVNTADICPVGALTQEDFRFQVRVWFLKQADTICPGCSRGCNVAVDYGWHPVIRDYDGKAYRLKPRVNDEVNGAWMCDFGRTEYHRVNDDRIDACRIGSTPGKRHEVVEAARAALDAATGTTLVVTSLDATLEEMHQARRLASEGLGGAQVMAVADCPDGKQDSFLLRADKHPNRTGAGWLRLLPGTEDLADLIGSLGAIIIHRVDLLASDADGRIRAALESVPVRIVIAATETETAGLGTHVLAARSWIEKDGHWINCDGRLQRIRRGARFRSLPGTTDDLELMAELSGGALPDDAPAAFAALVAAEPRLRSCTWESAGTLGVVPEQLPKGAPV